MSLNGGGPEMAFRAYNKPPDASTPQAQQTAHAAAVRCGPSHAETITATDRKHAKMRPAAAEMLAPTDALTISSRNL